MKTRMPSALIIFHPENESAARGFVEETLQYRDIYQNFYMLPIPVSKDGVSVSMEELTTLIKNTDVNFRHTESYLIEKKSATKWSEDKKDEDEKNGYGETVLAFARQFIKHSVAVTYDYFSGEESVGDLKAFRKLHRYTTSHGYSSGTVGQVPLLAPRAPTGRKKTSLVGLSFLGITDRCERPPYRYLLLKGMTSKDSTFKELDQAAEEKYREAIRSRIEFRQTKVDPIVLSAEHDYRDPESVAEKLGNLFHAYVHCGLVSKRSHKEIAGYLAENLYENKQWELEECFKFIKEELNAYPDPINPKGTFHGLKLEILKMLQVDSWKTGADLKECLEDKYKLLEGLKADPDYLKFAQHIGEVLVELRNLEKAGKQLAVIIRAANTAIDFIQHPSQVSYLKQLKVASEAGMMSASLPLMFKGLSFFVKQPIQKKMEALAEKYVIEKKI